MREARRAKVVLGGLLWILGWSASPHTVVAQAPATSASGASLVRGTVKAVDSGSLTVATDDGKTVAVTFGSGVRVQQMAPGSTDLKTAQPSAAGDIAVGDRVLVSSRTGEGGGLTASRIILMKSGAIAQRNEATQEDWHRRGAGGIVDTVDASAGRIAIAAGSRKETLVTSPSTLFRQYAAGSVKFEDAKRSSLAEIHPGDQLRVRGDKSGDGSSIQAEEIVFGSFRNLAGTVASVDAASGTITLKDLKSKENVAITVTANSNLRNLPPAMAATLTTRGGKAQAAGAAGSERASGAGASPNSAASTAGATPAGSSGAAASGASSRDLSQMIDHLPTMTLAEVRPGAALMVVASGSSDPSPSGPLTAVVVVSGVESLLAGVSPGGQPITLSPWNLGGGDAGASAP